MTTTYTTETCGFCGRSAENPRKVVIAGELVECCVGERHDRFVVSNSNRSAFVRRARKAGITGKW